ncbi:MAG: PilZ domain-containing protein [Nitrospiraceae bacterium]|nr:MAG: PilZ domain-containing protein [Nitrospiraceae bacterium]
MTRFIEKRQYKRIDIHQGICIHSSELIRLGTMTNCSERGMYIKTIMNMDTNWPLGSVFEVLIPSRKGNLRMLAQVVWLFQTGDFYEGMGVKLLDIPREYMEHVIRLHLGSYA